MSMTVGEVIAELQKLDKNLQLVVNAYGVIHTIEYVKFFKGDADRDWPDEAEIGLE